MSLPVRLTGIPASFLSAVLMAACPANAQEALKVVDVGAPAINCIFSAACQVVVTDSIGDIPLAGTKLNGRLQSRTHVGAPGSAAAGATAYLYRVDLSHVTRVAPRPCVAAVWISTGYPSARQYDGAKGAEHVFVLTTGGLGSVGVASAIQEGEMTKVTFSRPVCAGARAGRGESSFFFGISSPYPPRVTASSVQTLAGSKAIASVRAPTRTPDYTRE